jgi:O-antigen ligase
LQAFRGEARVSASLHSLEMTLLVIVAINLCFTPWALGTMHPWSQFISLALAVAAFCVALVNRHYSDNHSQEGSFKLVMWPKLIRFPLFWLGLALFGYIAIQALNPAWAYAINGHQWWLVPLEHITWLPSSIESPFKEMNVWRALMLYATPWMVVCAIWVGFTRRTAIQHLLTVVVANGAVLAIVGILERVTRTDKILWIVPNYDFRNFFSTIIYKNHAGAYFNLVFMLGATLFYWYFSRGERRLERASPAPIFAFLCALLGMAVLLTSSRAATILLVGFILVAFIGFIVRCALTRGEGRSPFAIGLLCVFFAFFIGLGAYFLNLNNTFNRVGKLIEDGKTDYSVSSRLVVREAAMEMANDNLVTGWGAGSFRFMFPAYQRFHPEIYLDPNHPERMLGWEYAHNDYVQLLDELGLIGATLILAMLACGVRHLWKQRIHVRPHLLVIALALAITMAHAFVDFPSHNPAILLLWGTSAALLGRWAELEARRDASR